MSFYLLLMFAFMAGSMSCGCEKSSGRVRRVGSKPQWDWQWRLNRYWCRKAMSPEELKRNEDAAAHYPSREELTRQAEAKARRLEEWAR